MTTIIYLWAGLSVYAATRDNVASGGPQLVYLIGCLFLWPFAPIVKLVT